MEKVRMKRKDCVRRILWIGILIFIASGLSAQLVIKGQVIDKENDEPIPFATVVEKGTTNGVATNNEGLFELRVSGPKSLLTVSTLGYQTREVKVETNKMLRIILEPSLLHLDEVVVTALGISRQKKALSYAVQDVKGDELNKSKQTNAIGLLSGKVAGLQVITSGGALGGSSRVLVRGVSSLLGNNQPLYVIDGTPIDNAELSSSTTALGYGDKDYGNTAADINPDDIENMSVLKGASTTALYGSRANNGVILITTKKGTNKNKTEITLSSGVSFDSQLRRNFPKM